MFCSPIVSAIGHEGTCIDKQCCDFIFREVMLLLEMSQCLLHCGFQPEDFIEEYEDKRWLRWCLEHRNELPRPRRPVNILLIRTLMQNWHRVKHADICNNELGSLNSDELNGPFPIRHILVMGFSGKGCRSSRIDCWPWVWWGFLLGQIMSIQLLLFAEVSERDIAIQFLERCVVGVELIRHDCLC